jgi:hypothetical protein
MKQFSFIICVRHKTSYNIITKSLLSMQYIKHILYIHYILLITFAGFKFTIQKL